MKSKGIYVIALIGLLLLAAAPVVLADGRTPTRQIEEVRQATARFHDVNNATRPSGGYAKFLDCITMPGLGAMGQHFVNGQLAGDGQIERLRPEALLYEPEDGKLKLTGVEYVVTVDAWRAAGNTEPPSLFGQTFNFTDSPNMFGLPPFYSLHAWIWKSNPAGMFQQWNPAVSCPMEMQMDHGSQGTGK
jgi:hypothetical protein